MRPPEIHLLFRDRLWGFARLGEAPGGLSFKIEPEALGVGGLSFKIEPDGRVLKATCSGVDQSWRVRTGTSLGKSTRRNLDESPLTAEDKWPRCTTQKRHTRSPARRARATAISPDGETGKLIAALAAGLSGPQTSIAVSQRARIVAAGGADAITGVWDLDSGAQLYMAGGILGADAGYVFTSDGYIDLLGSQPDLSSCSPGGKRVRR